MRAELDSYKDSLKAYIEATYHISDPGLVKLRHDLLERPSLISQRPYLESAARYATDREYEELDLDSNVSGLLTFLSTEEGGRRVFNPPYSHQAEALEAVLTRGQDLLVATGTGSGKTETFLLPLLGRLYAEAASDPRSFGKRAIRALILYPMNALVNDQLARLRLLFGSEQVVQRFVQAAGRPAKFGRYTGRTLFPGILPSPDDAKAAARLNARLKPLAFYLKLLEDAGTDGAAARLIGELQRLGKWPAKADLRRWYGSGRWFKEGRLCRAVEDPMDAELLLRHEIQSAPPDLMMTNYSMLEYTLLRPVERPIWSLTREYYERDPAKRLILVLDEAHLYRGASGTEVAMLLRRLRQRLGLSRDRLQVICTSASFEDGDAAASFVAQLSDKEPEGLYRPKGEKVATEPSGAGSLDEARVLASVDMADLHSESVERRWLAVAPLLELHAVTASSGPLEALERAVHDALSGAPVTGRLLNLTSGAPAKGDPATENPKGAAQEISELAARLFPDVEPEVRGPATDALVELAAMARSAPGEPPLLAARAHAFFRGLPGLWACVDLACSELAEAQRGGPTGALYAQPRERCACGARVFELHTCRGCGMAVAVGYSDRPAEADFLWSEPGGGFDSGERGLPPVHLALEEPKGKDAAAAIRSSLDPKSGRLGSGSRDARDVWTAPRRPRPKGKGKAESASPGLFVSCPRCGGEGRRISGHQTSGDEPFQSIVSSQLLSQPPQPDSRTPLKGRKVMIFSDGRQSASRLSGNLKTFSLRDASRPLLLAGFRWIRERGAPTSLDRAYAALLIGCVLRDVTPSLLDGGDRKLRGHLEQARTLVEYEAAGPGEVSDLAGAVEGDVPRDVLQALYAVLFHPYTGVEPLGLATFRPNVQGLSGVSYAKLPAPPELAARSEEERRDGLASRWLQLAIAAGAIKLGGTPGEWVDDSRQGPKVRHAAKAFATDMKAVVGAAFQRGHLEREWLPWLRTAMAGGDETRDGMLVKAQGVALTLEDEVRWVRCGVCTRVQPESAITRLCVACRHDRLEPLDDHRDEVEARTHYYRRLTERSESDDDFSPHPFVAEEHSAAIGSALHGELFARTELYELRFQDVEVPVEGGGVDVPVDVLSCTTTMEVGIDIGSLTGVALRNVPPGRANYQQRAGRAGRRGASLATVVTYCGADSHDQRFFSDPKGMVSGPVRDPSLKLENVEIVRRHAHAALLSDFQQERVGDHGAAGADLFMSLGSLTDFRSGDVDGFSYRGLEAWLRSRADDLRERLTDLVPPEVDGGREALVARLPDELLARLRDAGAGPVELLEAAVVGEEPPDDAMRLDDDEPGEVEEDGLAGEREEAPLDEALLLDRLFARGVLPRYAFPTDVVTFSVFEEDPPRFGRPKLRYAPQQGLTTALSQYAPGRSVWVDGRRWYSMALWSPFGERVQRYRERQLYFECSKCTFTVVEPRSDGVSAGDLRICPACRSGVMGPAVWWVRPPGFAHPRDIKSELPGDQAPLPTRPTRAKLSAPFSSRDPDLSSHGGRIQLWTGREDLTLTNPGTNEDQTGDPDRVGFIYCTYCGRIEPKGWPHGHLSGASHPAPVPSRGGQTDECRGSKSTIVLGTSFRTDVAVFRFHLTGRCRLQPGSDTAKMALTTLAEALAAAARAELELDPGEIAAEWRPALTDGGGEGTEVDVYLYDAVPGGAGYSQTVAGLPGDGLVGAALRLLEGCPGDGEPCDTSCYACLRSYQNRWLHGDLDRWLAADLLRHCMSGDEPALPPDRARQALEAMRSWLADEGIAADVREDSISAGGHAMRLVHPLLSLEEGELSLLEAQRSLPTACGKVAGKAPARERDDLRGVPTRAGGVPAYEPQDLVAGRPPRGEYDVEAPAGSLLVRLPNDALAKKGHPRGAWLVCRPPREGEALDRQIALVRRTTGAPFLATDEPWTIASVTRLADHGKVKVQYSGTGRRHRTHLVPEEEIEVLAIATRRFRA